MAVTDTSSCDTYIKNTYKTVVRAPNRQSIHGKINTASMNDKPAFKLFYFTKEKPSGNPKEVFRRLRSHSKTKDHPLLHAFITEATAIVREELRQAPDSLRSQLPPFENILDLAELLDWQQGAFLAIFESVFLCLLQLSLVIG